MNSRKKLIENIISLSFLQVFTYILPIVVIPYLIRILGIEKFGLLAFSQSLIHYFITLTDYGFNLTATRDISIHREDNNELSRIFSTVIFVKLILAFISLVILLSLILFIPKFHENWPIFMTAFLMVIGNVIFPVWFFQGMESMKHITALNILAKLISTVCIFIFVHKPEDVVLAVGIQSSGNLIAGIIGLLVVGNISPIKYLLPSWSEMTGCLTEGWYIFISQAAVTLFSNTNIFILGIFSDAYQVGYFAVAEKITKAFINLSIPIVNAIYPRVSSLFSNSRKEAIGFLKRIAYLGVILFSIFGVLIFFGADFLVTIFSGQKNELTSNLIRIMSILPLTIFLDNIYGTQILLNIGKKKQFMYAILTSGIFSLLGLLVIVPYLKAVGAAVIFTLSEIIVLLMVMNFVHRSGIYLWRESK